MVFQKKLPGPPPRLRRSALQLAQELKVDVSVVMDALKTLGEYVDSPRKCMIEEPVVKAVHEHLGRSYRPEAVKPAPGWQRRDHGGPSRQAKQSRRAVAPQPANEPHSSKSADTSLGLGDPRLDAADAWAFEEWKVYQFSPAERDAWIDAGLRRGQAKEAARLRDAGLTVADLSKTVYGWTVAKRLRGGETPGQVIRQLAVAKDDDQAG